MEKITKDNTMLSPSQMRVLLEIYEGVGPEYFKEDGLSYTEILKSLNKLDMVYFCPSLETANEEGTKSEILIDPLGEAWLLAALSTPFPERGWVAADGRIIELAEDK